MNSSEIHTLLYCAVIVIMLSLTASAAGKNITELASGSADDSTDIRLKVKLGSPIQMKGITMWVLPSHGP